MNHRFTLVTTLILLSTPHLSGADNTPTSFDKLIAASELTNRSVVTKDGIEVGRIGDVVIDRESGCVAFIAIRSRSSANTLANSCFLPPQTLHYSSEQRPMMCSASFEQIHRYSEATETTPITLAQTVTIAGMYDHYSVTPYWSAVGEQEKERPLITAEGLDGRIVRDREWHLMARVKEVVVEPKGRWPVAYLSLGELAEADTDERLAVPMAAFTQETLSATWLLNVPSGAKLLKQTFTRGEWPLEVDRGWTEFLHVKLGTAVDSGRQVLPVDAE